MHTKGQSTSSKRVPQNPFIDRIKNQQMPWSRSESK